MFSPIAICVMAERVKVSVPAVTLRNRETRNVYREREYDTLALLGIMILACRARISNRGRYFEITEAGNSFAESRFPVFRERERESERHLFSDVYLYMCVYVPTYMCTMRVASFMRTAALKPTLYPSCRRPLCKKFVEIKGKTKI